jgi:hypothetical protein
MKTHVINEPFSLFITSIKSTQIHWLCTNWTGQRKKKRRYCKPWNLLSRLPHFLDNRLTHGGEVVNLTRRPPFTPQEDSWYSFLLQAKSIAGAIVRLYDVGQLKILNDLIGNRTATFRLVANPSANYATACTLPMICRRNIIIFTFTVMSTSLCLTTKFVWNTD